MFISENFFLKKRNFIDFKKLHQCNTTTSNFSDLGQSAHNLKESEKQMDKLMTINSKTRSPSMCPDKRKILDHSLQDPRCHHKHLLRSRLQAVER